MFAVYIHRIVSDILSKGSSLSNNWKSGLEGSYPKTQSNHSQQHVAEGTHVDNIHEVPNGRACRVCSAGWRTQDSLEISIAWLKVQFVVIVYLYWAPEDSSRSTGDEQDPCLETRKIHIFDYNLSPVGGGEEVKCIVRRKGFLNLDQLRLEDAAQRSAGGPRRAGQQATAPAIQPPKCDQRLRSRTCWVFGYTSTSPERGIGKLRCWRREQSG